MGELVLSGHHARHLSAVSNLCLSVVHRCDALCVNATGVRGKYGFLLPSQSLTETENPCVGGSTPPLGTMKFQEPRLISPPRPGGVSFSR